MDFAHSFGQVGMDCELQTSSSQECTVRVHGCGVSRETPDTGRGVNKCPSSQWLPLLTSRPELTKHVITVPA